MAQRVNVRWLLAVLIALPLFGVILPWALEPGPEPRPTLVGADAPDTGVLTPLTVDGRQIARTKVPASAAAKIPMAVDLNSALVWVITATPGIDIYDDAGRVHTATLIVHTSYSRLGTPVARTISGRPAVELAYGQTADSWAGVATVVFTSTEAIVVNCDDDDLAPCATALAHLEIA